MRTAFLAMIAPAVVVPLPHLLGSQDLAFADAMLSGRPGSVPMIHFQQRQRRQVGLSFFGHFEEAATTE
jgi:hypothetical protein